MIVVTGAFGFIGSCLIHKLCSQTLYNIVAVDVLNDPIKLKNVSGCPFYPIAIDNLFSWLDENHENVKCVVHLGANSDTTEFNRSLLNKVNTDYTKSVWEKCSQYAIPLIYASSAATYGKGVNGYDDDVNLIPELQPLNPYGESKQDFDKWAIQQTETPPAWYGLKFFNVYGPYEFHKGRMASVVYHAYNQIKATGKMKLFKSYRPEYQDGMQLRDFVFVNDVVDIMFWLYKNRPENGIYNVGTGKARSFIDLVNAVFAAMNRQPNIEFIDMPEDIRDKYQYFTEAKIEKLRSVGYDAAMTSLEDGVKQYIDFLEKCNV